MGEDLIVRLSSTFGEEEDRVIEIVSVFEKAIDTVNKEITTQLNSKSTLLNSPQVGMASQDDIGAGTEAKLDDQTKELEDGTQTRKGFGIIEQGQYKDK